VSNTVVITPTSKGSRIWLQALESKGINWRSTGRVKVEFSLSHIELTFGVSEGRKVTASKGGIVDLQSNKVAQWAHGSTEARVLVDTDTQRILITRI
jgi:hypothetical protein